MKPAMRGIIAFVIAWVVLAGVVNLFIPIDPTGDPELDRKTIPVAIRVFVTYLIVAGAIGVLVYRRARHDRDRPST